jgi:hypothetical protein
MLCRHVSILATGLNVVFVEVVLDRHPQGWMAEAGYAKPLKRSTIPLGCLDTYVGLE